MKNTPYPIDNQYKSNKIMKSSPQKSKGNVAIVLMSSVIVLMAAAIVYLLFFRNAPSLSTASSDSDETLFSKAELDSIVQSRVDSLSAILSVDTIFQKSGDATSSMTKGEMWWCNLPDPWKTVFRGKMNIKDDVFPSNQQIAHLAATLKKLDVSGNKDINTLSPLTMTPNITELNCSDLAIDDISPLAALSGLVDLNFSNTQVSDITALQNLTQLQLLTFTNAKVASLNALSGLKKLKKLDCSINHISDLTPISDLSLIVDLNCSSNQVSTLKPVSGLVNLKSLNCSNTKVGNLFPLFNLSQLEILYCFNTKIGNLDPLYNLDNLKIFYYNNIEDQVIEDFKTANPDCTVLLRKK